MTHGQYMYRHMDLFKLVLLKYSNIYLSHLLKLLLSARTTSIVWLHIWTKNLYIELLSGDQDLKYGIGVGIGIN